MCVSYFTSAVYVILISSVVLGAPVAEKDKPSSVVKDVQDQEKDLQDLLRLVSKQGQKNDVIIHKEQVSHFENNNGEKVKIEQKEEKVVDTKTGDVVADVKQEVKQEASGKDAAPETVVETKVDIPAAGVHETFVQEGEGAGDAVAADEEPELTPADMAEYLYITQQFDAFYAALDRLVNQSKMTPEDAELYAKTVAIEYERLQMEDFEDRFLSEKRMMGQPTEFLEPYGDYVPAYMYPPSGPVNPLADPYSVDEEYLPPQELANSGNDLDPYEFLAALWNEAYGKGNEEAQEIVGMLLDRVSQDANPDDMGQIRDILLDTVASSLNDNSLSYQPIDMPEDEIPPVPANQEAAKTEGVEPKMPVGVEEKTKLFEVKEDKMEKELKEKVNKVKQPDTPAAEQKQ